MAENYHANFTPSITSDVIELRARPGHLRHHRRSPMKMLSRSRTFSPAAGVIPWLLKLATQLLARSLNMPEPLVHTTGMFVFAHVAAVESSVGKTLCPIRLLRRLQSWLHQPAR
jgi:hypothetical protein